MLFMQVKNVPEEIKMEKVWFKECEANTSLSEIVILDPTPGVQYNFTVVESTLPLQVS